MPNFSEGGRDLLPPLAPPRGGQATPFPALSLLFRCPPPLPPASQVTEGSLWSLASLFGCHSSILSWQSESVIGFFKKSSVCGHLGSVLFFSWHNKTMRSVSASLKYLDCSPTLGSGRKILECSNPTPCRRSSWNLKWKRSQMSCSATVPGWAELGLLELTDVWLGFRATTPCLTLHFLINTRFH